MATIPFAKQSLIRPGASDPRIEARIGILHVDAANAYDLEDYFRYRSGGIESHGHIPRDGSLFQYRDTAFQADANYRANDFALSFETQGYGTGTWTDAQISMIKRVMLWCVQAHGIPLRQVSTWNDPRGGWGYHTLFGAPSPWTPVAKSCPGEDRKKQFHNILVPWMATVGDDMAGGVPNFEERIIESNTRIEEMLKAIGAKTGSNIKEALEVAQRTNDARDEREGR